MVWFALVAQAQESPHDCLRAAGTTSRPDVSALTSVVGASHPVRVWYDPTHPNSAAIVDGVVEALDQAWDVQVDQLGFRAPVLPDAADGPELDLYLVDIGPFGAYTAADTDQDVAPGDGFDAVPAFVVLDRELPLAAVPPYVAHEFNHVCELATDQGESVLPLWEGTATAAQGWTAGAVGRWELDVVAFQATPWAPTLTGTSAVVGDPEGTGYSYENGAALWIRALDETRGDGKGGIGAALWAAAADEGAVEEPDAVDAFEEVSGTPLGDTLNHFALTRFLTGDDWDRRGLSDAKGWSRAYAVPALPIAPEALGGTVKPDPEPMITGQTFVDIDLASGQLPGDPVEPFLVVTATSASGLESGLMVTAWDYSRKTIDKETSGASPRVELPLDGLTRVVVGLTNLGPTGWDGDDDPYVPGDQVLGFVVEDHGTAPAPTGETGDTGVTEPTGTSPTPSPDDSSGCGCDQGGGSAPLIGLIGLLGWRRRTVV